MSPRTRVSAAARVAATADDLSATFAKLLAEVLRDTERRLVPIVQAAAEGSRTAIIRASMANRTRVQIREALTAAGFDELAASAYGTRMDTLVARVLDGRRLADLAADLTPRLEQRVEALKALASLDLLEEGEVAARALHKATVRGVFSSRPTTRILGDLAKVIDRTEPQIQTLYDTSVSLVSRQVESLQAGDDKDTRFTYLGPVDEKTRSFCMRHVGKVYTRAQIDKMDNGQLPDVFLTGGGYNCRHVWNEVSKLSDLWPLGDSNKRMPEVEADLKALKAAA